MTDTSIDGLEHAIRKEGVRLVYAPVSGAELGMYNDTTRTITVDPALNERQTRCALCHELIHARYHDTVLAAEERRTRRMTALTLIDTVDYQLAERVYGPDPYRLAEALDVTVAVVRDWQDLAEDNPGMTRRTRALYSPVWVVD